jgi:hypothetical protein
VVEGLRFVVVDVLVSKVESVFVFQLRSVCEACTAGFACLRDTYDFSCVAVGNICATFLLIPEDEVVVVVMGRADFKRMLSSYFLAEGSLIA